MGCSEQKSVYDFAVLCRYIYVVCTNRAKSYTSRFRVFLHCKVFGLCCYDGYFFV